MKIRYYAAAITAVFLMVTAVTVYKLNYTELDKWTLVEQNAIVRQVEEQLAAGDEVTVQDGISVIYIGQEDYEHKLYEAYALETTIMDLEQDGEIIGKVIFPSAIENITEYKKHILFILIGFLTAILVVSYVFIYICYRKLVRPFHKLEQFAAHISKGNFEFALPMEKDNYFGAFTESFDIMREELKKARQGEYEANQSKKELVASLSHDIKTPVATIKANCELLQARETDEYLLKKLSIIDNKADTINTLITDMFHATLEEMQMLKVIPKEELSTILRPMFDEMNHYGLICFEEEFPPCLLLCDKLRLAQVIDNVISNSYKYANTKVHVKASLKEQYYEIVIRDEGKGISDEELPLVFEKFYRGKNATSSNGSGLGLYLAKQFMEKMDGRITCYNDNGFAVVLQIKIV